MALRYQKKAKPKAEMRHEQYQLFDTPEYRYRVFVTNLDAPIDVVVGFYRQRAGAENLIKEANNDAGLAAHPSARWAHELRAFPVGDAGLQPELLADAVQPGGAGQDRGLCITRRWRPRVCASCFWRPRSCATPARSWCATAIITPNKG